MSSRDVIEAGELASRLDAPDWAVVDVSYWLAEPERGEATYLERHIPSAVYAHLDRDLSSKKTGSNGRHPLPEVDALAGYLGRCGIGPGVQVVAYDQDTGAIAARLWWLLRYLGHLDVAVLSGGLAAWSSEGRPLRAGRETRGSRHFEVRLEPELLARWQDLEQGAAAAASTQLLIDARTPERYRGELEPIDPVGGHIPGALNHHHGLNVGPDGRFLPAAELERRYASLLGGASPASAVVYCGSGVTACQNLLALERAGLGGGRLYAGSWSEWCADPARPVETGPGPGRARREPLRIQAAPHPGLHVGACVARFPAPLGELPNPAWLEPLLALDAEAPLARDEALRQAVRDMLRQAGYKPTGRGKPASEYLARAAAEGELRAINPAVDALNAVSLHSGLPISVVDLDRARPPFRLAVAAAGEGYVFNASGQVMELAGIPCLVDGVGACANGVKDSERTKTSATTRDTLSIIWGVAGFEERTQAALAWYRELLGRLGAQTELAAVG